MSHAGSGRCGVCGRAGTLVKRACAEHPDLCKRCYRAHQPRRECGVCGRSRSIHSRARGGEPDICNSCARAPERRCGRCGRLGRIVIAATANDPALGRCCYQPPLRSCSDCGRERPCVGAGGPEPLCATCNSKRHTRVCIDCGEQRQAHRRVEGGVLCASCDRRRGGTDGGCRDCGTRARLITGRCPACRLGWRIQSLRERGDPAAAAALEPYLVGLAGARNADSRLRWLQSPALALLEELLAGTLELSHAALDRAQDERFPRRTVAFLRAALVDHGVLEPRDEHSAAFASWQQRATEQIEPGPDRAHVRAYASWQVAHQLARTVRRGSPTPAAQKHARSSVSEAIKLVLWLHAQRLELANLRQDLIDAWIADGATTRRKVRLFLVWLARGESAASLQVDWNARGQLGRPLADNHRFAVLRRLLHDGEVDPRDRLAGCLLLLYAQPLTRTAALRTSDIAPTSEAQTSITLARGAIVLPEPLGSVALALRDQRLALSGDDGWLMAGRNAGTHITAERLRERLKPYGITSRAGRHAALLALGARLPAPILAERLGFQQARAAQWVRAAGASYADYVALRSAARP